MTLGPRVLDKMNIYRIYHKPRQNRQNIIYVWLAQWHKQCVLKAQMKEILIPSKGKFKVKLQGIIVI